MAYSRELLDRLAEVRLAEAKALVSAGQPSGAYYLAGYAVECALKAKIAARFRENEIPDKTLVSAIYTHDIASLVRLAGLESELDDAIEESPALGRRWAIVEKWSEQARYAFWTNDDAMSMIDAIDGSAGTEGLMQWLTNR